MVITFLLNPSTFDMGLAPLDLKTSRIVLLTDAYFVNAKCLKSPLGCVFSLVDCHGHANIIHYGSNSCQGISRSVMVSGVHVLVIGFEYAYIMYYDSQGCGERNFGETLNIQAYVDIKAVEYCRQVRENQLTTVSI